MLTKCLLNESVNMWEIKCLKCGGGWWTFCKFPYLFLEPGPWVPPSLSPLAYLPGLLWGSMCLLCRTRTENLWWEVWGCGRLDILLWAKAKLESRSSFLPSSGLPRLLGVWESPNTKTAQTQKKKSTDSRPSFRSLTECGTPVLSLGNQVLRASQREPRFGACSPAPHCACDLVCVIFSFAESPFHWVPGFKITSPLL